MSYSASSPNPHASQKSPRTSFWALAMTSLGEAFSTQIGGRDKIDPSCYLIASKKMNAIHGVSLQTNP